MSEPLDVYVLFNATSDKPFIMESSITGALGIFSTEDGAKRAKAESEGTDYKRVTYYKQHHIDAIQADSDALRAWVADMRSTGDLLRNALFSVNQIKERLPGEWQYSITPLIDKWDKIRKETAETHLTDSGQDQ